MVPQTIPIEKIPAEEKIYIPIITKAIESPFWNAVQQGAEKAASDFDLDISFEGTKRGATAEEQLDMLRKALDRKPQAIVFSALDSRAATPYLEEASESGIPIIGFDSGVDSPIVKTTVATDNYGAGALAAEKMAQLIGGKGKVGVIVLDRSSRVGIDRGDGFVDTLTQEYPNIEVLPVAYNEGDDIRSKEIARDIIIANSDIKGMFGANENTAIGIMNAVKELNKEDQIVIIGFDAARVADAVKAGCIAGAIAQNPVEMGYKSVEAAYRAYKGERNPEFIDTGFKWYDQSNIDDPEIQKLLYE
jgi:ribose transport system substrate-binding protein